VTEGGGAAAVSVWLSNRPQGDVYVMVHGQRGQVVCNVTQSQKADDDDLYRRYVDDDGLQFAMVGPFDWTNWDTPRRFTVTALEDDEAEWSRGSSLEALPLARRYPGQNGDDTLVVTGVSIDDKDYSGLAAPNVTVLVQDDEVVGVEIQ